MSYLRTFLILCLFFLILLSVLPVTVANAAPPARGGCNRTYIVAPSSGSIVSGAVVIVGAAWLPEGEFHHYQLQFSSYDLDAWVNLINNPTTPIVNGALGFWNAGALPDGAYKLRLLAVDRNSQYCEAILGPVYVSHNPVPPTDAPTSAPLDATATPRAARRSTKTPVRTATPTATEFMPGPPTLLPSGVTSNDPQPLTPTVVFQVPAADVPSADATSTPLAPLLTVRNTAPVTLPFDVNTILTPLQKMLSGIGQSFISGIQLTAGFFLLLGAVAFLRRNV